MMTPSSLISFGPTAVDSFDYYRENDKSFDAYLLELTTWMQPNDAMKRGTAFEQSLYAAFRTALSSTGKLQRTWT